MATINWHDTLPSLQLDFNYRQKANVVYTEMDTGVAKARRINDRPLWEVDGKILVKEDSEVNAFLLFLEEIADGALPFYMNDPVTGFRKEWLLTRWQLVPAKTGRATFIPPGSPQPQGNVVSIAEIMVTMTRLP